MNTDLNSNDKRWKRVISPNFLLTLAMILIAILIALKIVLDSFFSIPEKIVDKGIDTIERLTKIFSTKESFRANFGPIVSQSRLKRLQFFERNQVCFFRIVRYRSKMNTIVNFTQFYKKESDKKETEGLPILLNQYCVWEAKGTFEFNFFVDLANLANLDKWEFNWDKEKFTLTLYPPDIAANRPAETETLVFTKVSDRHCGGHTAAGSAPKTSNIYL